MHFELLSIACDDKSSMPRATQILIYDSWRNFRVEPFDQSQKIRPAPSIIKEQEKK
jgi:hypothetical protein